jgi:hypothetical protein
LEQDTLLSRDTLLSPTKGEGPLVVASRPTIKANGFVFINTFYVIDITKFLNVKAQHLSYLINVKGYNKKARSAITYIL